MVKKTEIIQIMKWVQTDFEATVEVWWNIIDLTWYTANFIMLASDWTIKIDSAWIISTPTNWIVQYKPTAIDVDTVWDYRAYFELSIWWVKKLAAPTEMFTVQIITNWK